MKPGDRISAERKALGMSQKFLAKDAGISQGTLSEIESGITVYPRGDSLVGICRSLRLHPAYVTNGKGPKQFDWNFPMEKWMSLDDAHQTALIEQLEFLLHKQKTSGMPTKAKVGFVGWQNESQGKEEK